MVIFVSKSEFKPKAFEYFRMVEKAQKEICITDHGKPVLKIVPYEKNSEQELIALRNLVEKYEEPFKPIDDQWDVLK